MICAIFLGLGSATLLYLRVRLGPGPFIIAFILSCIVLGTRVRCISQFTGLIDVLKDISLTVGPFFPYPYYTVRHVSVSKIPCLTTKSRSVKPSSYLSHFIRLWHLLVLCSSFRRRSTHSTARGSGLSSFRYQRLYEDSRCFWRKSRIPMNLMPKVLKS